MAQATIQETAADSDLLLRLSDLLPDAEGELVLLADGDQQVRLLAGAELTGEGIVDAHVTASGYDVSGLSYFSFANGITLYYSGVLALEA